MTRQWQQPLIQASESFNPDEIMHFDTLTVPEHLTATIRLPGTIRNRLAAFAQTLYEKEPSLLLVKPDNYHVTIASAPLETGIDHFKAMTEEALRTRQIELDLSGILLDSAVIAAIAYPQEQELYAVREQILNALGKPIAKGPRGELGWSSIARFKESPSRAMVDLALKEVRTEWGHFKVNSAIIYKTTNKHLDGATRVAIARSDDSTTNI